MPARRSGRSAPPTRPRAIPAASAPPVDDECLPKCDDPLGGCTLHVGIAVAVADPAVEDVPGVHDAWHDHEEKRCDYGADRGPDLGVHAASEACGSASTGSASTSPRVLVARSAITADARMKMLPSRSARWKPAVSACEAGAPAASRWFVRLVDTAVKMARPSAPPSHCDALSSAAASPALS